jgi:diacylglycerol kinase
MSSRQSSLQSFRHALDGVRTAWREERNFRVQCLFAVLAIAAVLALPLSAAEAGLIVLAATVVLVVELINSVVERTADLAKPRIHQLAHDIKDIAAAAVFVASCGAVVVGVLVVGPHLLALVGSGTPATSSQATELPR